MVLREQPLVEPYHAYCRLSLHHTIVQFMLFYSKSRIPLPRFSSLRRNHLARMARNPRSRPRHERCDIKQFTTKEETDYMDVFEERGPEDLMHCFLDFCLL